MANEPPRVDRRRLVGYAYVSTNGQLVIDRHPTDNDHLIASQTRETQPLYDCRVYFSDLFPKEWIGKRGEFVVHQLYDERLEIVTIQFAFTPAKTGE